MSASLEYSVLTRLLTLNGQRHDLENQLMGVAVPRIRIRPGSRAVASGPNSIAEMQEEIDRGVRASLTTCWLGTTDGQGE